MRADDVYDLPGGYVMVAQGSVPVVATLREYGEPEGISDVNLHYTAIFAGGDGAAVRLWWAIGMDEAACRAMLDAQRGVFISYVVGLHDEEGRAVISWKTDEPSQGRVEYGTGPTLGTVESESAPALDHTVTLPGTAGQTIYYRIVAPDSYGDETLAQDGDGPFVVTP